MEKHPLIRTIYLYLFACLGLVLLTIGSVCFLDMGLKAFVFTKAEQEQRYEINPPLLVYPVEKIKELENKEGLTEEEKIAIKQWLIEYKNWQERKPEVSYVAARRHRDASLNLSLILIGLPLYLYHWRTIKKEMRNKGKENV